MVILRVNIIIVTEIIFFREEPPIHDLFSRTKTPLFTNESCFCFEKSLSYIDISKIIDPNANGLERLVVYFYKDIKSNMMKMYIPNIEKQRLIPNLAYDSGDYLTDVTSQEIFDIINTNPNMVDDISVYQNDFDISIYKDRLSHNIGEVQENHDNEDIPHFINYVYPAIYINDNATDEPYLTDIKYISAQHTASNNQQLNSDSDQLYTNNYYSNETLANQPISEEYEDKQGNIENKPVIKIAASSYSNSEDPKLSLNRDTSVPTIVLSDYTEISEETSDIPETKYISLHPSPLISSESSDTISLDYLGTSDPLIISSQKYSEINTHGKINTHVDDSLNNYNDINNWVSDNLILSNYIKSNSEISIPEANNAYVESVIDYFYPDTIDVSLDSPYVSVSDLNYPSLPKEKQVQLIYPYKGNYFDVFENWFKNQMEEFRESQTTNNDLNDIFVRRLVQEILLQNDIFITKAGIITKDGVKLNINNLNLRPIMIGDSVGYDKLLETGEQFNAIPKLNYLKAVLVSLINPPKVLGVIPLGKMHIPNKNTQIYANSKDTVLSDEYNDMFAVNDNVGLGLESRPPVTVHRPFINPDFISHKDSSYKKSNTTVKYICDYRNCKTEQSRPIVKNVKKNYHNRSRIEHERLPHRIGYKLHKALTKQQAQSYDKLTARKNQKGNRDVGEIEIKTRRFPLAKIFSQLLSLLNPEVLNNSKVIDTPKLIEETNRTENKNTSRLVDSDFKEGNENHEIDDEEDSMYRIIGGSPATGTGAPLNVRGKRLSDT